jgi:hypothetical protein
LRLLSWPEGLNRNRRADVEDTDPLGRLNTGKEQTLSVQCFTT